MALLLRNPVIVFAMLAACLGTVSVLTFARPELHPRSGGVARAPEGKQRSVTDVRRAFAAHGIRLRRSTDAHGVAVLMATVPFRADALHVAVRPKTSKAGWAPDVQAYDERFDNVVVTYGGSDEALMRRIDAAVDDLR